MTSVPDRQDPQRGPGGPRRQRARPRWPRRCCPSRGHQPARPGRGRHHRRATPSPRSRSGGISLSLALAPFEWEGHKINLIDTPGLRRLRRRRATPRCGSPTWPCSWSARSTASRCRPRRSGGAAAELGVPRMVFVNKLDRERADFERTLDQLRGPVRRRHRPARAAHRRGGGLPRRRRPAHRHRLRSTTDGDASPRRDPRRHGGRSSTRCTTTSSRASWWPTTTLMERYLEGDMPSRRGARAHPGPRRGRRPACSPSCAARPSTGVGIDRLADFICEIGPSPARPPAGRRSRAGDADAEVAPDPAGQPLAFVFKTIADPYVGQRLAVQGAVRHDPRRRPARQPPHGRRRAAPRPVHAAGQGAGAGHRGRRPATSPRWPSWPTPRTGDTLAPQGHAGRVAADRAAAAPCSAIAVEAPHPGRRGQAGHRPAPAAGRGPGAAWCDRNDETHQTLLRGHRRDAPGDRPRAAASGSSASTSTPRTCGSPTARRSPARPRPRASTRSSRGGHGQFGVASIRVEPLERGRGLRVRRQDRRRRHPPPVHPRGARRASRRRWPTAASTASRSSTCGSSCFDGKYHSVDSLGDELQDGRLARASRRRMAKAGAGRARADLAARGHRARPPARAT